MTHIHTESTLHWPWGLITSHLYADHGIDAPAVWTVGKAHEVHLKTHLLAPEAKEPQKRIDIPVSAHTECLAYYGVGDGTTAICRRPVNHPEVSEDGIGHSPQPIPVQDKAEEAAVSTADDLRVQLRLLTEERDRLDRQLQMALSLKDQAVEALSMTQTASTNLQQQVRALQEANDRQVHAITALERRLEARTAALEEGRRKLLSLINELKTTGWEGSVIFQRLVGIVGGDVSTGDVPVTREEIATRLAGVREEDNLDWARKYAAGGQ